ncbi:MAG: hypothetical protein GKR99_18320 [Rhodobacteraceae bacterium]|nr:hypothetical protein [Paracoccaceae bacterium]
MARTDDTYTKTVKALRLALPLGALIILSTVFLVSKRVSLDQPPPFDELRLEQLLSDEHITGPSFATMTDDGSSVSFAADRAQPRGGAEGQYLAEKVRANIETSDGGTMHFEAPTAELDQDAKQLVMGDGVTILTSTGYRIEAETFTSTLDQTSVASAGEVTADGPVGKLTAGQMELLETDDGYVVVFKDRINLIYDPTEQKDDTP